MADRCATAILDHQNPLPPGLVCLDLDRDVVADGADVLVLS